MTNVDKQVWAVIKTVEKYRKTPTSMKLAAKAAELFFKLTKYQVDDLNNWLTDEEQLVLAVCCVGTMAKK